MRRPLACLGLDLGCLALILLAACASATGGSGGDACAGAGCVVTQLAAAQRYTCAVVRSGELRCWGGGVPVPLAPAGRFDATTPALAMGITDAAEVAAGEDFLCVRGTTGGVRCFGDNGYGQLGDGTTTPSTSGVTVAGVVDAVEIRAGDGFACARRATGEVVCWGRNERGQCGRGVLDASLAPGPVVGLADATQLSLGLRHACARRATGEAVCWGEDGRNQLGGVPSVGSVSPTPMLFPAGSDVAEVVAGTILTCVRRTDGTGACWGGCDAGQCGLSSDTPDVRGRSIPGLSGASSLGLDALGCATLASGGVQCWGGLCSGYWLAAHGAGPNGCHSGPDLVAMLSDAVPPIVVRAHVCVRRGGGGVACWGRNDEGQLGDGTTTDRDVPVAVVGLR